MNYTEQPKTKSGRTAWQAFAKAMGQAPVFMSYGHGGAPAGWQWTAEDNSRNIWIYKASWAKAHIGYDATTRTAAGP